MKYVAIIISMLLLPATIFAGAKQEDPDHIVIATDATWPPMEYVNEEKEIVGFTIDMVNQVAERAGLTVTYQNASWDGIFAGLSNGDYDAIASSVTITEERKERMLFSIPYLNAGQVLVVRADTDATTLNDLTGSAVGAQIGTTGALEIEKVDGVTLRSYDELGFAMEDLVNGRIDGVVSDTPIAADFALQNDNYQNKLKIVGETLTSELYGIAIRKDRQDLLEKMNNALEELLQEGSIEALKSKWLR